MKAVFIGAHNDDIEYCAGGMAYHLKQAGFALYFLKVACKRRVYKKHGRATDAFSDPAACAEYDRQDMAAAEIFGAHCNIVGGYANDYYTGTNEDMLLLRDAVEEIMPDMAFIHWMKDSHWDHVAASRAAFQVLCEHTSCEVHAFEAGPWQSMNHFTPDFLINITDAMPTIEKSLAVFDQPLACGAALVQEKQVAAQYRGYMAGFPYAEAYKILRFPPQRLGNELMLPKLLGQGYRWGGGDQYPFGLNYYL